MSKWIEVAQITEIPKGSRKAFNIEGQPILIINLDNSYFAIENRCTHEDYPLEQGYIEDDIITCPFHGAQFCIKTGEVKAPPAFSDVAIFKVRINNKKIEIQI